MTGSRRAKSASAVAVFTAKTRLLALARLAQWALRPQDHPAPALAPPAERFPHLLYERAFPIVSRSSPGGQLLEAGKLVNVALAVPALDKLGPVDRVEERARPLADVLRETKIAAIDRALAEAGSQARAAKLLGLKPPSLSRMLRDLGMRS